MDTLSTPENNVNFAKLRNGDKVDIGIIVVSWNVKDILVKNLSALYESRGNVTSRIIVVDNASNDGTAEEVKAKFPDVTLIVNHENAGFAKAVNQGLEVASSKHVLLLNPDMLVQNDSLQKTIEYLDAHDEVGILGAWLIKPDGSTLRSIRRFPDLVSQIVILLKLSKIFPSLPDNYSWNDFDYAEEKQVPSIRGSYFAISENGLKKIPRLDERYFIWFEEVDYCRSMAESGLKTMYVPSIKAMDLFGQSFRQRALYWKQKNFTRSMEKYFWKWKPGVGAALISCLRPFVVFAAWIHDLMLRP
ncbi:MAG: glycosyltransferase family 2 protein [Patescibacteria group bacterium]